MMTSTLAKILNDFTNPTIEHLEEFLKIEGEKGFEKPLAFFITLQGSELYNILYCLASIDMDLKDVFEGDPKSIEANKILWTFITKQYPIKGTEVIIENLSREELFEEDVQLLQTKAQMAFSAKGEATTLKYNVEDENKSYLLNKTKTIQL